MNRVLLSEKFHELCDNVYYQPPPSVKLKYPCIIYERRSGDTLYADNKPYRFDYSYTVTYIDPDPDSNVPFKIAELPMCKMDRCFTSDNLNHSVFIIYYHVSPTDLEITPVIAVDTRDNSYARAIKSGNTVMVEAYVYADHFFATGVTRLLELPQEIAPKETTYFPVAIYNPDPFYDGRKFTAKLSFMSSGVVYLLAFDWVILPFNATKFRIYYELD